MLQEKTAFGELTQTNKADAGKISKGKEENRKKQKHQKKTGAKGGQTIKLVNTVPRFVLF